MKTENYSSVLLSKLMKRFVSLVGQRATTTLRTKKFSASTAITFFTSLTVPKRSTPIRCAKLPKKNFTPAAANF